METTDSGQARMTLPIMKISFIATVLNEEKTIEKLLISVMEQTKRPDEIIIVDGGSSDKTVEVVENYINSHAEFSSASIRILKPVKILTDFQGKLVQDDGRKINRAKGRNEAIRQVTGEIILMSDAGCELDKRWVEEITKPFFQKFTSKESWLHKFSLPPSRWETDVVAGYYQVSKESSVFQRCVACYALVMPDKVDPENFLPSARSMAIRKSVFEKFGGFPEDFSDNEDYVFANRLKDGKASIVFNKEAIVYWQPVLNLKDFFTMIFRFARGDAKAGLRKRKVATVFGRYLILGFLGSFGWLEILGVLGYLGWSVYKNYRYVRNWQAFFYLPILQIAADIAIMLGTMREMRLLRFARNDKRI